MKTECLSTADGRASMEIAVDFGGNLCSWKVEGRELLYREAAFGQDPARVYEAGGTPLLFPAVGRQRPVASCAEMPGQEFEQGWVVVHEQNGFNHHNCSRQTGSVKENTAPPCE